jgi:hypothetical protein
MNNNHTFELYKDVYSAIFREYRIGPILISMTSKSLQVWLAKYFSSEEYLQFMIDHGVKNGLPKMIKYGLGPVKANSIVAISQKYLDGKQILNSPTDVSSLLTLVYIQC